MFLTDYHIHSSCSDDGHNTMLEMALASYSKGVKTLCFTDHCDIDHFMTGEPNPSCYSHRDDMIQMYAEARDKVPSDMKVFLGMELGEGNHDPQRAITIAASPELDFVLGSVHNLKGTPDFYDMKFHDEVFCRKLIDDYMDELIELSLVDCFDVMAHIGYPVRYARKAGFNVEINTQSYGEKLAQVLRNLIERGKGIEINCSGFRNPLVGGSMPSVDVLKLYRDLGGEIITVGSDAHEVGHACLGLAEGFDILRDLGYKYVTVFEKRKPSFIEISK
ncbi:MAG: histidinol-phosphatase HisJ family protein [Oscillospiraceae bacterium]|nr:histidinol-phosphatase HisJ family protein [Oscillospiraceae bacterium]